MVNMIVIMNHVIDIGYIGSNLSNTDIRRLLLADKLLTDKPINASVNP